MTNIKFGEVQEMVLPKAEPPQTLVRPDHDSVNDQGFFSLYILRREIQEMEDHLDKTPNVESGGLLIGHPFVDINNPDRIFTVIVGSVQVKSANSSIGHYTVSPEELLRARSKIPAGLMSVGWYHSHPGHGVFLSGADMKIMESIYCLNWQIAFVFDTLSRKAGFFYGKKGSKVENIFYLDRKPAIIEAIIKYNCAISAKEDGDDSAFENLKNWAYENSVNSTSLLSISDSEWQKEFNKAVDYFKSGKLLTAKPIFEYLYKIKRDGLVLDYLKKIDDQYSY